MFSVIQGARYVHTNLIARDWRKLAEFYQSVLGCVLVPPERHFSGAELEAGTGVRGSHVDGVHLRMPGNGEKGPTIEIFTCARRSSHTGGGAVGDVVTLTTAAGRQVTWGYVTDPEGNVVELQSWK